MQLRGRLRKARISQDKPGYLQEIERTAQASDISLLGKEGLYFRMEEPL